jgi:transcriptional regulator with XRE-family HTH domain
MPMTAKQLRHAIKRLGWTQVELARRLGVNPRTVRKWVLSERPISEPAARLIRTWLAKGQPD